jgi:tetratricopeptide (TPR) repeat protein
VARWYGTERRREPHYGELLTAGREARPGAARALERLAGAPAVPAIVRATALELLGRLATEESLDTIERGLADADPLVRYGAVEALEALGPGHRAALGAAALSDPMRAVRVGAARLLGAAVPPGGGSPALEAALAEYRSAQLFNADRPEAHLNLGVLHAQRGETAAAAVEYERALELAPWFLPAYVNLADLRRTQGREADGERLLREALEVAPDDPDALHALGLLLVRERRLDEAIDCLAGAAEGAPGAVRYAYVYGIALQSAGRVDEALRVLEDAHERHPGDVELLKALATISRDAGSVESALRYARRLVAVAPADPGAQHLLRQLERAAR